MDNKQKITFLSEGQKMEGTIIMPDKMEGKIPAVIFFHGMTSSEKNYIPIAEKLAEHGICGMTLSIRGHGNSEGEFDKLTINDAVQDGLSAYDFLTKYNFVDKNRIGLCGSSVGAAIVSMVSEQRKVKSLVLRVPATYPEQMMNMTYKQIMLEEDKFFKKVNNVKDTPALKAISQFKGSLLVVISEKDTIIPNWIPKEYLENAQKASIKKEIIMRDATHNLKEDKWRKEFTDQVLKWFTSTL